MRFQLWWMRLLLLCSFPVWMTGAEAPSGEKPEGEKQVDISADQVEYDQNTKMAVATGHAVIVKDDVRLTADKARYNNETKDLFADGNVRFRRGNQEFICESLYYSFQTKALSMDKSRSEEGLWYMQSSGTKDAGTNRYDAVKGYLTTCDYPEPHWRITYTRLEIYPGNKIVVHNAVMRIGNVPVFYWPYLQKSLQDEAMPLTLIPGVSGRFGPFLYLSYAWGLTEGLTLTPHLDLRTQHGIGSGLDLNYKSDLWGTGVIKGYYDSDEDPTQGGDKLYSKQPHPKGPVVSSQDIDSNRYRFQWLDKTELPADTELTIAANKLSDSDVIQDFFQTEFRKDIEPNSFADVTHRGEHYTAGVLAQPDLNEFFTTTERLPEGQLSFVRTPLWNSGLFYEDQNSIAELHRDYSDSFTKALPPPQDYNTVRADTFHQISYPRLLFGWLSVVPRVGGRATYYSHTNTSNQDDTVRGVFDTGAELSFKLSHVYSWNDDNLDIHGLRHVITPFVNYSYIWRSRNDTTNKLFQFDTINAFDPLSQATPAVRHYSPHTETTRYNPVDFPAFNAVDAIDNEDVFRTGIRNQFQTKRDGLPYDLIDLNVFTDLHINPTKKEDTDLFTSFEFRPVKWAALDVESRYSFDDSELVDLNTEMRVLQQDKWSVGLGTRFLRKDSSQAVADVRYALNENWAFSVVERVDMSNGNLDEQEYTLFRDLHCWTASLSFRYLTQEVGSDEFQVWVVFSLKALPRLHAHMGQ